MIFIKINKNKQNVRNHGNVDPRDLATKVAQDISMEHMRDLSGGNQVFSKLLEMGLLS